MAASANPSGNQHHQEQSSFNGGGPAASTSNGNSGHGYDNSGTGSAMKHNPGIATDWTAEEQAILEDGLTKYGSLLSIIRYAKVAMDLPNKTVRDVALRARWMSKKEVSKRRKDDHSRKNKDKREKVTESSSKSSQLHASRPGGHAFPPTAVPLDEEDGMSYKAIGGHVGELLEQNKQFFHQISANFNSYQIQDNINLFRQAYDNIKNLLNNLDDSPEIMKQMPQLPVKLNEELKMAIIPPSTHSKHS